MKTGGRGISGLLLAGLGLMLMCSGCVEIKSLKEAKPIIPNRDYDKMLLGNVAADYVGNDNCLNRCHALDKIRRDFEASTMGAQLKAASSGLIIVDCESCHGPGSALLLELDAAGLMPKNPDAPISSEDKAKIKAICKKNLLDFDELPAPVRSQICLKCHAANATFNLHNWNAGAHALNEVSCSNCHPIHADGANLILRPEQINTMCMKCHQEVKAEFSLPSRHPIRQNKMYCTDCHEQHGATNDMLLRGVTVKETCVRCHAEKAGPFLFEHGDVTEDCTNCHFSHGSMNDNLLTLQSAFLCKQCHAPHRINDDSTVASRIERNTRCTDCHSEVHGTDTPGYNNKGRFIQ